MMCAHVLKPHAEEKQTRFTRFTERQWERLARFYDGGLKWVLDHQALTLAVTIATLLFTFLLALAVPKGFFPQQDTGLIIGVSEASPDASFTRMMDRQRALAGVVLQDPDVAAIASFIGADGTNPTANSGRLNITLKPRNEREASATDIIARLRPMVAQVDGIQLYLQPVQDLQIETRIS